MMTFRSEHEVTWTVPPIGLRRDEHLALERRSDGTFLFTSQLKNGLRVARATVQRAIAQGVRGGQHLIADEIRQDFNAQYLMAGQQIPPDRALVRIPTLAWPLERLGFDFECTGEHHQVLRIKATHWQAHRSGAWNLNVAIATNLLHHAGSTTHVEHLLERELYLVAQRGT